MLGDMETNTTYFHMVRVFDIVHSSQSNIDIWTQHHEFPSGLPSKYSPGPMLLIFSVGMVTWESNISTEERPTEALSYFRERREQQLSDDL